MLTFKKWVEEKEPAQETEEIRSKVGRKPGALWKLEKRGF